MNVWKTRHCTSDHGGQLTANSKSLVQRQRRTDDQVSWVDNAAQEVGDDWQRVELASCKLRYSKCPDLLCACDHCIRSAAFTFGDCWIALCSETFDGNRTAEFCRQRVDHMEQFTRGCADTRQFSGRFWRCLCSLLNICSRQLLLLGLIVLYLIT